MDVRIGSRYFLGQVTASTFQLIDDANYGDVLSVELLDFHSDCTRLYSKHSLHRLSPIAFTHTITHYPLDTLPKVREHEFEIAQIYAQKGLKQWGWSSLASATGKEAKGDGEEEEEELKMEDSEDEDMMAKPKEQTLSIKPNAIDKSDPSDSAAAAASSSSSSARGRKRAVLPPVIPDDRSVGVRKLGHFNLNLVSDVDYSMVPPADGQNTLYKYHQHR